MYAITFSNSMSSTSVNDVLHYLSHTERLWWRELTHREEMSCCRYFVKLRTSW